MGFERLHTCRLRRVSLTYTEYVSSEQLTVKLSSTESHIFRMCVLVSLYVSIIFEVFRQW